DFSVSHSSETEEFGYQLWLHYCGRATTDCTPFHNWPCDLHVELIISSIRLLNNLHTHITLRILAGLEAISKARNI
ncbi:MAG: hypothetical protein JSV99_10425, partial [Planctomycetota bacterium]